MNFNIKTGQPEKLRTNCLVEEAEQSVNIDLVLTTGLKKPETQANSHFVTGCNSAGLREYRDDIPFNIGPSASKCPPEAPVAATCKLCLQI